MLKCTQTRARKRRHQGKNNNNMRRRPCRRRLNNEISKWLYNKRSEKCTSIQQQQQQRQPNRCLISVSVHNVSVKLLL